MPGEIVRLKQTYRDEVVRRALEIRRGFTDVVDVSRPSRTRRYIALLSLDGDQITHAALATRGSRVATGKVRVRYESVQELNPVSISAIELGIAPRFRTHFQSNIGQNGWIPNRTWSATLEFIRSEARNDQVIQELESQLSQPDIEPASKRFEVLAEERDALGLALKIFDPELSAIVLRSATIGGNFNSASDAPFVTVLQNTEIREDLGIAHDARAFDGWIPSDIPAIGVARFERHGKALTVANVNRTRIENVIGVDLLYFQHEFRSFVFVQYKRMSRENGGPHLYRPVGESYESEYQRMLEWDRLMRATPTPSDVDSFRLGSDAFFFKLYSNPVGAPMSDRLLQGMYFPLSYWSSLLESPGVRGPQGGIRITYENAGRYLTNTDFIGLVGNAWVGTSPKSEKKINEVIENSLRAGHSVTLAASQWA